MYTARIPPVDPAPATITAVLAMHVGHICPSSVHATFAVLPGTKAENWRSSALVAPARQPSAMDSDVGSGNISSSPFSTPSKIARATDSGEAFGMYRPRDISVSTGPVSTAWTPTPRPANSARSDCDSENAAAFEIE